MQKRKGQLVFEFIVATVLFITIVLYVINTLDVNVSAAANNMIQDDLEYKAVQIADILVKSEGDWNAQSQPNSIGLVDSWPYLSADKAVDLSIWCKDKFVQIKDKYQRFDLKNKEKIFVSVDSPITPAGLPNPPWDCDPWGDVPEIKKGYAKRHGLFDDNGDSVVITVEVWVWRG
ncbi:MAG: hypothetical protein ISS36_00040 [Candidatus Aenigmarchaeota archaeon]|nr:hypothetical protein [Candidatus Aenigmarchaeota archaeon]